MKRRHFITIALFALLSLSIAAWRYWWMMRRVFIKLKLMKVPANLLRNADFARCTHPNIPDFWGTADAAALQDLSQVFQIEKSAPLGNIRALRINNPKENFGLSLQSCATFTPKPQAYTFSIYLRSEVEQFRLTLAIGWGNKNPIVVSNHWQRYQITYAPSSKEELQFGFQVQISLRQEGSLWLAAPQLEEGEQATPFVTALMDDHPLPVFSEPETDELILVQNQESLAEALLMEREGDVKQSQINRLHRSLMKDSKPFLVFGIAVSEPMEWQLEDIANQGFNTVTLSLPTLKDQLELNRYVESTLVQLDVAYGKGLHVIPIVTHEQGKSLRAMIHEKIRLIQSLKHHPAILCWWIFDEPTQRLGFDYEKDGLEVYQAVKEADPTRPAFINENVWREGDWLKSFLQSTDIISMDMYPIGQYQNPLSALAERVNRMNREAVIVGKPTAFWLQLYGHYDAPREPTPDEQRAMTYLAFIRGVRLILYWVYKPMSQVLWESLKPLFEEIKRVSEIVMQDHSHWHSLGTIQIQIHFALWEAGEKFYLVACNISSESIDAQFHFEQLAGKTFTGHQSWYEGENEIFTGRGLSLNFAPYGRQVIELW